MPASSCSMHSAPASPAHSAGSKILRPSVGPPRFIVELYFRTPFSGETTNKAVHSAESSAWAHGSAATRVHDHSMSICSSQQARED